MPSDSRFPFNRRDFIKLTSALAGASLLAACQPGDEMSTALPGDLPLPQVPTVHPPEQANPSAPLAVIALNRMGFGPRPGDIDAFLALGSTDKERLQAYVRQQLDPGSIDDGEYEARYAAAGFEHLHKSLEELYADHIAENPYDSNDDVYWDWYSQPAYELVEATFLRAVYSRKQLAEVLADFWFNHFNVYFWQDDGVPLLVSYDRDALRTNTFGNFRQMLEAVATHPSMLYYLNQNNSSDAGPNENYARELFELHTLGSENYLGVRDPNTVEKDADGLPVGYVDNDVYESARAFTGWRVEDDLGDWEQGVEKTGRFLYYKPWHDRFNKLVLGRYFPADQPDMQDGRDVLDLLANHPGTARHIARKLCRRFMSDDPPATVIEAAATAFMDFRSAPDQLKRVYESILLSPEFTQVWGQKIKRPFEATAAMLRALDADFTRLPGGVSWMTSMMGQPLFERRPPDGYPDTKEAWANSMSLLYRWNFAVGIVENWLDDGNNGHTVRVNVRAQTPDNLRTPASLADYWIERLLGRLMSEEHRQAVIDFIRRDGFGPDDELPEEDFEYRLNGMVEVILMSPDFSMR